MTKISARSFKKGALKGTLLLPRTDLPIRPPASLKPSDNQKLLESCTSGLYKWQSENLSKEKTFVLHDGPPYANGDLHMGHALNKILKDIINRFQILSGNRVSYIPGWDCHGLPIELKALQNLQPSDGKTKNNSSTAAAAVEKGKSMTPLEIRTLAGTLASKTIEEQKAGFESWGVMGDWDNSYKTMDREYEINQLGVFKEMLKRGLIYRRFKPVYWSPSSGTALAEAELEYNENHPSKAAFVKFPIKEFGLLGGRANIKGGVSAAIWTTTPWTIPANKAIAVHRDLEYSVIETKEHGNLVVASQRAGYVQEILDGESTVIADGISGEELLGAKYAHPLLPETAPLQSIILADFVTADSGTGLVHCAPGHGMEDYLVCQKHEIPPFSPVDSNGRFTDDVLPFGKNLTGLEVLYGGTKAVLELLTESKALLHLQPKFTHKYPYDWRTKLPVIVRATAQWFADVDGIKGPAVDSLSTIQFIPESGRSRLTSFVQGRSEWCISRQRAWGVPIPALYDSETNEPLLTEESVQHITTVLQEKGTNAWWQEEIPEETWVAEKYSRNGKKYTRGKETMDVWFDSGTSWATLKTHIEERPGKPLADLYLEGSDQHRGWFQSSLLTSIASSNNPPFGKILTHGFCLDQDGKKMSKSIGNVIAPEDIIQGKIPKGKNKVGGVDMLRLWVAYCDYTKDVVVGDTVLSHIHECLRKMRVTARFLLGNLEGWDGEEVEYDDLTKIDQFALAQLYQVNKATEEAYKNFQFNKVVNAITTYTNSELSAFYLDVIKDRAYSDPKTSLSRRALQTVVNHILGNYLSILTPIVPLLTQEIWSHTPPRISKSITSPSQLGWYQPSPRWNNSALVQDFETLENLRDAVKSGIERAKAAQKLKVNLESSVLLVVGEGDDETRRFLEKYSRELSNLFIVSSVSIVSPSSLSTPSSDSNSNSNEIWYYESTCKLFNENIGVIVRPAMGFKCVRCWVYTAKEEEGVCGRCAETLEIDGYGDGLEG